MSQVIDRKIVDMEFNNSRFESNVQTTLGTLDKLRQSLNFKGAEKAFDNIESRSEKIKMAGFQESVLAVSTKFSALEQIAIGALRNIGEQAVNFGKNFIKSVSIDQVSAGWEKYAQKTSAVQTIMAATRKEFEGVDNQMELVEEQLGRLNWFTDETSYKFVDMVNNIGKFTSSGVKLETATTAMQGIATWAAISGANATQASNAMYNLSQALGVGAVTVQDWKSIENANMATQEFKQTAIEVGIAMGKLKEYDGVLKTYQDGFFGEDVSVTNFREGLKDKWFTSEVLMKTLDVYGGFTNKLKEAVDETDLSTTELLGHLDDFAEGTLDISKLSKETGVSAERLSEIFTELNSDTYDLGRRAFKAAQEAKTFQEAVDYVKEAVSTGWMNTFEIIFGNYEKAKKLWSEVAENFYTLFVESGEERNDLLRAALYKDEWDDFAESVEKTTMTWDDFSKKEKDAAKAMGVTIDEMAALKAKSEETNEPLLKLIYDFKKLSGRDLIINSIHNAFEALFKIIDAVKEAWADIFPPMTSDRLYGIIKKIEDFTKKLILSDERIEKIKNTLRGIFSVLDIAKYYISTIISFIKDLIKYIFKFDDALDTGSKLGDFFQNLRTQIKESDSFGKFLDKVSTSLKKIIDYIKDTISGNTALGKVIRKVIDGVKKFIDYIKESIAGNTEFGKVIKNISDGIKKVISKIKELTDKAKEKITVPKVSIIGILEGLFSGINAISEKVMEIGKKVWPTLKKIFETVFGYFKRIFETVKEGLKASGINDIFDFLKAGVFTGLIMNLFKGSKDLKSAGKSLKDIVSGISDIFGALKDSLKALQTELKAKAIKNIAIAIGILAVSMLILASIDAGSLSLAFIAITGLFMELSASVTALDQIGSGRNIKQITSGLIKMAAAVLILAFAMKTLAEIPEDKIANGLLAIAGLFAEILLVALALSSGPFKKNSLKQISSGLLVIAVAMIIFAAAMKQFAKLEWEDIGKGLTAIAGLMAIMVGASKLMGNKAVSSALALTIMSTSLITLYFALKLFAKLEWEEIGKGLAAIGGLMLELAMGLNLMQKTVGAAISLTIVAAALLILAGALAIYGKMDWANITKALITIGILLIEISVGMVMMQGSAIASVALLVVAASLLVLYGVLRLFGDLEWSTILKGLVAIAALLAVVAVMSLLLAITTPAILAVGAALIVFGAGLVAIGAGLAVLGIGIEVLVKTLSESGKELLLLIPEIAVGLAQLINTLVVELITMIGDNIPLLVETLLEFILETLKVLSEKAPDIVKYLADFIIGILDALAEKVPDIIVSLVNLLMSVLQGFVNALKVVDTSTLLNGIMSLAIVAGVLALLALIGTLIPQALVGVLGFGLLVGELSLVLAAVGELYKIPGLTDLIRDSGEVLESIGYAIGKFVGGIVGGFGEGLSDSLPAIAENLSVFAEKLKPFIDVINSLSAELLGKVLILEGVLLTITGTELVQSLGNWLLGESSVSKFGSDIVELGSCLAKYAESVSGIDQASVDASAKAVDMLVKIAKDVPNEGGIISWFTGDNTFEDFADGLPVLGSAIKSYSDSISENGGLDIEAIGSSTTAVEKLVEIAKNVPNMGGIFSWYEGDADLGKFGDTLGDLGSGLKAYSDSITKDDGLDLSAISQSIFAVQKLVEIAGYVPQMGGISDLITGYSDLGTFGSTLEGLGSGLKTYSDSITKDSGIDFSAVSESSDVVSKLIDISNNIKTIGGIDSWFGGKTDFEAFGKTLESFGGSLSKYYESIKSINFPYLKTSAETAGLLIDLMEKTEKLDKDCTKNFVEGLKKLGESGGKEFAKAFDDSHTTVKTAAEDMITAALKKVNEYKSRFYDSGKEIILGLINGLKDKDRLRQLEGAGRVIGRRVLLGTQTALDSHSPSRKYEKLGAYCPIGLYKGVLGNLKYSEMAGEEIASVALDKTSTLLSNVNDILESDMNLDPVIRPVLDLDNIKSGAARLNTLLGSDRAYSVSARMLGSMDSRGYSDPNLVNNYNFTQNNYSPKALSPVEIYRQTNNQFSALKKRGLNT